MAGLMGTLNALHHPHGHAPQHSNQYAAGEAHTHTLPLIAVCVSTTSRGVVKKGRVKIMTEADRKRRLEEVDQVGGVVKSEHSCLFMLFVRAHAPNMSFP